MDHDYITKVVTRNRSVPYGVGITPNPYVSQQKEWVRRHLNADKIKLITDKVEAIFEPRFITPPETSECIEAIVRMTDSRKILEVGTCTGFTTMHILRALVGKDGASIITVDSRPAHDAKWFEQWKPMLQFVEGWTPGVLADHRITSQAPYDMVFVDSDHSLEHTQVELEALWKITQPKSIFLFHDLPEWPRPDVQSPPPVRTWILEQKDRLRGYILPTCEQLDCLDMWGPGYPKQCNPHLGIFIRT